MGYYIEVPERLEKAKQLKQMYGAQIVLRPESVHNLAKGKTLICVVENGTFDAAGIIFNDDELADFAYPDGRPRTWLVMDKAKVLELKPHMEEVLEY